MEQFYFQYEWDPSLRRQARQEIQRQDYLQRIQLYSERIGVHGLVFGFVAPFTVFAWMMADRLAFAGASLFYDSLFSITYLIAVILGSLRFSYRSANFMQALSAGGPHWSQWLTILVIIFTPSLILLGMVDIVVPASVLFPLAITVHESCALIWDWAGRNRARRRLQKWNEDAGMTLSS